MIIVQHSAREANMEQVTGIGGLFFRARDPKALGQWYQDHLGVALVPSNYEEPPWQQEAGPTVFTPFPETADYFGPDASKTWIVNFRVRSLDAMVAQLRAAGVSSVVSDSCDLDTPDNLNPFKRGCCVYGFRLRMYGGGPEEGLNSARFFADGDHSEVSPRPA